jgi:hypothetical protein
MNASRMAVARSVVVTSLALGLGPVAVLLAAGARGRFMWDLATGGLPIWQPGHWLVDPRIAGTFAIGVALIAAIELRGGARAAQFRLAVRLAPVAFVIPVILVLIADPALPTWLAWPITTWGTGGPPRALHEVLLALATPLAFVGILFPARWLGTRPRTRSQLATPVRRLWLAIRVYLVGYLGASLVATIPPVGTVLGLFICALPLGLVLAPGLIAACSWWARSLPVAVPPSQHQAARWRWVEPALLAACAVLAFAAFSAMTGTGNA